MGNDGGTKALSRKYSRWSTKKEVAHVESEEAIKENGQHVLYQEKFYKNQ